MWCKARSSDHNLAMSSRLTGKRALVTAGAQGIGLAISRELAAAGCRVYVHYHSSGDAARQLCSELGSGTACGSGDLTRREECRRVVAEAVDALGGLDVLVNNAGSLVGRRPFAAMDDEFWDAVMRLNIDSARWVTEAALPHLIEAARAHGGASIVNLASVAGRHGGGPGAIAYSTAKGAMLTLTRGLATEYASKGVRVNAVTPGLILGSAFHAQHTPEEMQQRIIAGIPLGRAGTTEDVARAVVFLASEYDGFITGATLDINGGVYLM